MTANPSPSPITAARSRPLPRAVPAGARLTLRPIGLIDDGAAAAPLPGLAADRPLIMGIVNVTPDSFSDGGPYLAREAAVAHGRRLHAEGADIVDVGGESTRPGAPPVPVDEEMRRALPVVEALAGDGIPVSIDTRRARVMAAAAAAGARMLNDVSPPCATTRRPSPWPPPAACRWC